MKLLLIALPFLFGSSNFAQGASSYPAINKNIVKKIMINKGAINSSAIHEVFDFYSQNKKKEKLRDDYIGVVDFSLKSTQKRLALINIQNGTVELFKVSHGKGSDKNHDTIMDLFSSKHGSNATPAGFHKMGETYHGKHGLSVRMHGLETRNKTSLKRLIVLHGAKYVSWKRTGRSKGCPAVENKHASYIIKRLKNGGLFYHYLNKK